MTNSLMIAILSTLASLAIVSHSHADTSDFDIASFYISDAATLTVSGDGDSYSKIDTQDLSLSAFVNASFYAHSAQNLTHKIEKAALFVPAGGGKFTWKSTRQLSLLAASHYPFSIVGTKAAIMPIWKLGSHNSKIIALCNKLVASGKSPSSDHTTSYDLPIQLIIKAGQGRLFKRRPTRNFVTRSRATTRSIPVVCKALKSPPRAGAKITITKFNVIQDGVQETCPRRHDVNVKFRSVGRHALQFRIRTNQTVGTWRTLNLTKTGEKENGRSVYTGLARAVLRLNSGKTEVQAIVKDGPKSAVKIRKVKCGPFKITSAELKYENQTAHCPQQVLETAIYTANKSGPFRYKIVREDGKVMTQGRAVAKRQGNKYIAVVKRPLAFPVDYETKQKAVATSVPIQAQKFETQSALAQLKVHCLKLSEAKITLTDPNNDGQSRCPRKGRVASAMTFNRTGTINYRIGCTNGFSKTGSSLVRKNKFSGLYAARFSHEIDIEKEGNMSCVLQDADHNNRLIAATKKFFACKAPTHVDHSDDVAPPQLPDPDGPKTTWSGSVTVANTAPSNICPREDDQVFFDVERATPGSLKYHLGCNNGQSFSGTLASFKSGDVYKVLGAHKLRVTRDRFINCTLREVKSNGQAVSITSGKNYFRCRKNPSINPATDDVAPPSGQEPDGPPPASPQTIKGGVALYAVGNGKQCPREGRSLISLKTNKIHPIPYMVRCTGAGKVEDVAKSEPHSQGGWITAAMTNFTINQTGNYTCHVFAKFRDETGTLTPYRFVAKATRPFTCANRVVEPHSVGLTGSQQIPQHTEDNTEVSVGSKCRFKWKTSCERVPDRTCKKTVETTCSRVPKSECRMVRTKTCRNVPTTKCKMRVTRSCKRVPKVECRTVRGKRICKRTMTTRCEPQRKRVCSRIFERKCTVGTKRECKRKMTRVCSREPSTSCNTSWRKSCTRQKVRVCS